jgi:cytochrome b561
MRVQQKVVQRVELGLVPIISSAADGKAQMEGTANGTITFILSWFLSEHTLHGITFLSLLLVLLGFLYLSYDLLGKPQGILNSILIVFTHLAVSILVLLVLAPLMLFLFQQVLRATHAPPHLVDPGQQIGDIIVYTLMIGVLQGALVAVPDQGRPVERFRWRDSLIGFIFALIFFSVDEFLVFHTPINDWIDVLLDLLFFVFMGVVGAGFWRRYGKSPHNLTFSSVTEEEGATRHVDKVLRGKDGPLPALFSFTDFIRGVVFWYIVGGLSIILWSVLYVHTWGLNRSGDLLFYLVDFLIGAAPASLVCGSSQYITWKVHRLGDKQLGVIGACVTIFGGLLGLLEPLVLFLTTH